MTCRRLALSILALAFGQAALAQDVAFALDNTSSLTLMEFYASPQSAPGWGGDILGADVLTPGSAGSVTIASGGECAFAIRLVFDSGDVAEDVVDICTNPAYTITD